MKKHFKLLLGGLLLAMALVILPTIKTEAAATVKTLSQDGKWVKTDKYYVKWTDTGNLYYKVGASGTSHLIVKKAYRVSVNGTNLAIIYDPSYFGNDDVIVFSLTTKTKKKLDSIEAWDGVDIHTRPGDVAIYGSYLYASYIVTDDADNLKIVTYKIHMSTKKRIKVSTLCGNRFYQNGTKLICLDTKHRLRIYDFSQLKFTKTICSNTKGFSIIGSKLHYVKFMPKDASSVTAYAKDYDYEVKICSLTGSVYERYPLNGFGDYQKYEIDGEVAFAGTAVYFYPYYKKIVKFSYKTDSVTDSSETTFNTLCKRYYTVTNYRN